MRKETWTVGVVNLTTGESSVRQIEVRDNDLKYNPNYIVTNVPIK